VSGAVVLQATGVALRDHSHRFDFTLRQGEVVGLAGLEGHGQAVFLEVLAGIIPPVAGEVTVQAAGSTHPVHDTHAAFAAGVVYLPQDRKSEGIFPSLSILDNFRVLTLGRSSRYGVISSRQAREAFERHRQKLDIILSGPGAPITSLSGGNQQKVLLARLLEAEPRVMLLNDPTRGVDYPTRLALFAAFEELATEADVAIVVLSTEIDEIISHCHRGLVFREGVPRVELDRDSLTRDAVLAGMFGVDPAAAGEAQEATAAGEAGAATEPGA
jgi:ribose transport system ATP-binding protein